MTRRRWIADEVSADHAALIGGHARHLAQVLRAQVGQEFDISTGTEVRRARVSAVHPDRVDFDLGETIAVPDQARVAVAISVFKFDRMEWAIEKCAELGVSRIIPLIAARTESHLANAAAKRVERWQRIARQASEQSRRLNPPEISSPFKLKDFLAANAEVHGIVLSEVEDDSRLKDSLAGMAPPVTLALGPEGGWKENELADFQRAGWKSASLGPTILRAETAIIAAIAIARALLN